MSQEIRSKFKYHLVTHSEHNVIYEDAAGMILVREKYFTENAQLSGLFNTGMHLQQLLKLS